MRVEKPWHWYRVVALHRIAKIWHDEQELSRRHGATHDTSNDEPLVDKHLRHNRVQEISEIARGLKSLARELKVPVIALSQLSRAVERREDKRPMLSDLRESGSIEAEADLVMMLYRPDYYVNKEVADTEAVSGHDGRASDSNVHVEPTEVIIAKHRNGPTGTVKIGFVSKYAAFENLIEDQGDY